VAAEQLSNRYSGQGHRASLTQQRHYDEEREAAEMRYGEERALWLRERAENGLAGTSASSHDPVRLGSSMRGRGAARRHPGGQGRSSFPERGRDDSLGGTGRLRAPSPRASGTTRFVGRVRLEIPRQGARGVNPPISAPNPPRARRSAAFGSTAQSTPIAAPPIYTDIEVAANKLKAMYYALHPGKESDQYHRKHPDRLPVLRRARAQLVQDLTPFAAEPAGKHATAYFEKRQGCEWMLKLAIKAMHLVQEATETEIDKYLTAYPEHKDFVDEARGVYRPRPRIVLSPAENTADVPEPSAPADTACSTTHLSPNFVARLPAMTENDNPTTITTTVTTPAAVAVPPTSKGSFVAKFYDAVGRYLGDRRMWLDTPITIAMDLCANGPHYDPRVLCEELDTFVETLQTMQAMQDEQEAEEEEEKDEEDENSSVESPRSDGSSVEGAKLARDGCWDEDEEL